MPVAARYSSADQLVCELPAWPYAETVTSVSILNLDTGSVLPPHPADETFFLNFRGAFREAPVHACLHPLRVSVPAKVGGVLRMQRDANVHPPPPLHCGTAWSQRVFPRFRRRVGTQSGDP